MNRLTRLLTIAAGVLGTALAIACANDTTGPGAPELGKSTSVMPIGFTRCDPQPYASAAVRIGPSGGSLKAGRHILKIPAGALKKSVRITMQVPSDTVSYVIFGPEGLTFDAAHLPTLKMSYGNCRIALQQQEPVEIVYTNAALTTVLETTELVAADTLNKTVDGKLKHFSPYVLRSRYAVAF